MQFIICDDDCSFLFVFPLKLDWQVLCLLLELGCFASTGMEEEKNKYYNHTFFLLLYKVWFPWLF